MSIQTQPLDTWTNYDSGPIKTAKETHQHIRERLEDSDSRLNSRGEMRFDTLLQGSYANTTIVHESSDVDILVRMNNPYNGNITSRLSSRLQDRYREEATFFDGDYSIDDFQQDVYDELQAIYGTRAITRHDKALVIDSDHCQLEMDADVVPCQQHRIYTGFNGDQNDSSNYYKGIRFKTQNNKEITSFPERHISNGEEMNDACNGNYKETIRMFKNARDWLVEHNRLDEGIAPSYYIECLLYNVPEKYFRTTNLRDRYSDIVSHLDSANFQSYKAQNDIESLFGRGETQWGRVEALRFVNQLQWLWENGAY